MSAVFDKLKAMLDEKKALSDDDITKAIAEHGELSEDERVQIEAARYELQRSQQETITMDQYLAALKVLDTVDEGSDEFKKAEAIVDKYEAGS